MNITNDIFNARVSDAYKRVREIAALATLQQTVSVNECDLRDVLSLCGNAAEVDRLRASKASLEKLVAAKDGAIRDAMNCKRGWLNTAHEALALTPASLAAKTLVGTDEIAALRKDGVDKLCGQLDAFLKENVSDLEENGTYTLDLNEKETEQLWAIIDAARDSTAASSLRGREGEKSP